MLLAHCYLFTEYGYEYRITFTDMDELKLAAKMRQWIGTRFNESHITQIEHGDTMLVNVFTNRLDSQKLRNCVAQIHLRGIANVA